MSSIRRSRHCRVSADNSISAMLSQDPCLGVWWIWEPLRERSGLGRLERLIQGAEGVGVQVVHHQQHPLGVGIVDGEQMLDHSGPSPPGCAVVWRGPCAGRPAA